MAEFYDRTAKLIGEEGIALLKSKKVIIFGCGGVGGYVAESFARCGIGEIGLCDFDKVDVTNINRQIIALQENIGNFKTEEFKKRIVQINPECKVHLYSERYTEDNGRMLEEVEWDYCIDAIDSIRDKVSLILACKKKNIKIISAMGAGNRIQIPRFDIIDIYDTKYDGLSKAVRKRLRAEGVEELKVCCTDVPPIKTEGGQVGSIVYFPAVCGMTIAAFVVNQLLETVNF